MKDLNKYRKREYVTNANFLVHSNCKSQNILTAMGVPPPFCKIQLNSSHKKIGNKSLE